MKIKNVYAMVAVTAAFGLSPVWAQEPAAASKSGTAETQPAVDHSQMDHSKMGHDPAPAGQPTAPRAMDHGSMQGGSAPPDARDPHAYSGGQDFGPFPLKLADRHIFYSLLVDRLEAVKTKDHTSGEYELQARVGTDYNRLVLKAEGDVNDGRIEEARRELLWGRAVAAYWDTQLGVRYDSGEGPDRGWLAFGIQGLAPYWFELDATAYVGERGRSAFRLAAEYELLITQKLVLQPRLELNAYGKRDAGRELGAGLSDLVAGIRLRYEIRRQFAPYLGIEWAGKFGGTADHAKAAGNDTGETRYLAGVRLWF